MHSTLMMWEAIRYGKKRGLKIFDLWGAAAPGVKPSDPWLGFTTFKQRFGPKLIEFTGSYDLVINPVLYRTFQVANYIRWFILKIRK